MRTLIAILLLSSSASAALLNTPNNEPGYLRLRLVPGQGDHRGAIPTGSYIHPLAYTPAYTTSPYGEPYNGGFARSLWTNVPNVALWDMGFSNVPFYHNFSIELALGLPEVIVRAGEVIPGAQLRRFTYSTPGGYLRNATASFTPAPEPGAAGMMVAWLVQILARRRGSRGRS